MKYHINYDGKVMPCRATIKGCPYGDARHSEYPSELYMRYQNTYTEDMTPPDLKASLEAGDRLSTLSVLSEAIENSPSPMETICSSLVTAYKTAGNGNITSKEEVEWSNGVNRVQALLRIGQNPPKRIPREMVQEAQSTLKGGFMDAIFNSRANNHDAIGATNYLLDHSKEINRINERRNAHEQLTPEFKRRYKQDLYKIYQGYADALNTRKLLSQPAPRMVDAKHLIEKMKHMPTEEVQALYDETSISDSEIKKRLERVNNFEFKPNGIFSLEANKRIYEWYQKAKKAVEIYEFSQPARILISVSAMKILSERQAIVDTDTFAVHDVMRKYMPAEQKDGA